FLAAARSLCDEIKKRTRAIFDLRSVRWPERLPAESELTLYRIVQEALNNVEKHSKATRVLLSCAQTPSTLHLTIQDNGRGFRLEKKRDGLGLSNIRERAQFAGGTAAIRSAPGRGTEIVVSIPFDGNGS
ncbi:MAG: histidine kinase, partial [Elusimicrobia bacterium]|nr:histidine kinase [Elusimicrobiota bacterium]